jgi:cytochrome c peroxidase
VFAPNQRRAALLLFSLTIACHDAGTAPSGSSGGATGSVAEALTVDLASPPNYRQPQWTVDFDAAVRSRTNEPLDNPVTDRGALLGRVLFYDRRLSINERVSCATCHRQQFGFTDTLRFSVGFSGVDRTGFRAMRLLNARFYTPGQAFWNRRTATLEDQATQPIQNAIEMGFDSTHGGVAALLDRMEGLGYYSELFTWVYGDSVITEARIQLALAQWVRSLVSYQSRFDSAWARVYDAGLPDKGLSLPFPGFTAQENRGKQLYVAGPVSGGGGCVSCHVPPAFALVGNSLSNGLDEGETRIFKAPSLRSVAAGGPYMHDGRFRTLAEVVTHYVSGVREGPALDTRLRAPGGGPQRLALSGADQAALIAFLKTLTDNSVARDPKFSDPFRR